MKKLLSAAAFVTQCALVALLTWESTNFITIVLAMMVLLLIGGLLWPRQEGRRDTVIKEPEEPEVYKNGGGGDEPNVSNAKTGYFENYIRNIGKKIGQDAAGRVRSDVEAILGTDTQGRIDEILSKSESRNRAKGLVVGRVQSGKTMNFTGLITRAIDEGWNTVIVLTSNNTALESQTISRLRKDLSSSGLTDEKYALIDSFLSESLPAMDCLKNGRVYVGFALKQADHLRGRKGNGKGVIGWLKRNEKYIGDANIIVIDDESDNATQNTAEGASDWSDESVLRYADKVRCEGIAENDERWLRVAEWIKNLVEAEDNDSQGEDRLFSLKAMLDMRIGEDEVRAIIHEYSDVLRLNRKVRYGLYDEDSTGAPVLSGFVEAYFTQRGTGRGHSRGDDMRAILRWFLEVRKERSVINECITTLVSKDTFPCAKMAYVGYTATPYANFLNEQRGSDNPLELDFAQSMSIAPEYFGLFKIFGNDKAVPSARMPIVMTIPEDERSNITRPFMDNVDVGLDESLCCDYVTPGTTTRCQGSWDSLKRAIKWAVVSAAIRRENRLADKISDDGDDTRSNRWTTMLINLSRKIEDHGGLRDAIQAYLNHSCAGAEDFKKECLDVFDELSRDIDAARFFELFHDYPHKVNTPCRAMVEKHIDYVLKHIRVMALNSDSENLQAYEEYVQDVRAGQKLHGDWLWIVIGGNRISRGLTFDGLVSSYFDRDGISVNVDTLTQMGRWFGYRVGYELLPRVWMPAGAVATMKEICELEEDMHTQLNDAFERHEDKPAPKMLSISRRLTGRDQGMIREAGVENPMIVREFLPPTSHVADGVAIVSSFLEKCGCSDKLESNDYGKVYAQLDRWLGVEMRNVESFIGNIAELYPHAEYERLDSALLAMKAMGGQVDVVLANPKNKKQEIRLEDGHVTHPHGIGEIKEFDDGSVRLGKFSGQYDAWKAVVPQDIVESVERDYGIRANTNAAIAEMFVRKAERGLVNHPVLQVGFVDVKGDSMPYVAVYCPGEEWLKPERVQRGDVIGESEVPVAPVLHAQRKVGNTKPPCIDAEELFRELGDANYRAVTTLSPTVRKFLQGVKEGRVAMPHGFGYWHETRSGYGGGAAVFKTGWAKDEHEFLSKVVDEAVRLVVSHAKANPNKEVAARDIWRKATNGRYNGILELNGKHVLPGRLGDKEECLLREYGVVCVANGQSRPLIRAL